MDAETKRLVQLGFAWCGPLFVLGYIVFWAILGHNVPPPNMMGLSGEQLVAEYYGKYQNDIAIGMIGCATIGLLYTPWSLLLATMLREEDGSLGVLALTEAAGGILTGWLLAFCPAIWATCALLVGEIGPELVKTLHVATWIIYDCTYMITSMQLLALGTYIVLNKKQAIFPAWTGWCAIAIGVIFVPLVLMPFVSGGPFAVGGSWNFYFVFGIWLFAFLGPIAYFMLRELIGRKPAGTPVVLSHAG
ncbi:MAG TPA: hypothetical protein VLI72_16220 [Methylibium sp.]|nr:hypothetical protein [Methylibium sp.]